MRWHGSALTINARLKLYSSNVFVAHPRQIRVRSNEFIRTRNLPKGGALRSQHVNIGFIRHRPPSAPIGDENALTRSRLLSEEK